MKLLLASLVCALLVLSGSAAAVPASPPNIILIFCDDLGYGDLGCYGAKDIPTPHLDRMAAEGVRFTDFYAAASVCMPSRAALLTGCYPPRVGITGNVHPHENWGLHPRETSIAELLEKKGYATGIIGKWHLGHREDLLPCNQGFKESYILPYSHDMYRGAPWGNGFTNQFPKDFVPILSGTAAVGELRTLKDFSGLTHRFHEEADAFVRRHAGNTPFFLYLAHTAPHLEIQPAPAWAGKTARGPYGDVVAELDDSIGRLFVTLKETGLEESTLVIFTSDNGPAHIYQKPSFAGGSVGPLSGGKNSLNEGGFRMPAIFRWPGTLPSGKTCRTPASTLDVLPTCAALAGVNLPDARIDGKDLLPLLRESVHAPPARDPFLYFIGASLEGIRSGKWKLWLRTGRLYDLDSDAAETTNLAAAHPETAANLAKLAAEMGAEVASNARKRSDAP